MYSSWIFAIRSNSARVIVWWPRWRSGSSETTCPDAGSTWARMAAPTTAYDDLVVHPREKDLVIGTHGRGIWVLDDTTPLAEWGTTVADAPAHVFPVRPATIFHYWKDTSYRAQADFTGENPVDGAIVTYSLGSGSGPARIRIERDGGGVVREMSVPSSPGVHRINWDLRHALPEGPDEWQPHVSDQLARSIDDRAHFVSPGTYRITLEARGTTSSAAVVVNGDPEMPITLAQYREREEFLSEVLAMRQEVERLRSLVSGRGGGSSSASEGLSTELNEGDAILQGIYQSMNGSGVRQGTLYPPTGTHRARVEQVRGMLARVRAAVDG